MSYLFTSESVSAGHPDKICDQISDAILDEFLLQDANAKVACECLITTDRIIIAGETKSFAKVNPVDVAKNIIREIGYDSPNIGFDCNTATYENLLHNQSLEINNAVSDGGAGDQGLMFGYATNETRELMPLPILLAHKIMEQQNKLRKDGTIDWLLPDAKSQVIVRYENEFPVAVEKVVVSTQHKPNVSNEIIKKEVSQQIILPVLNNYFNNCNPDLIINPSGSFTIGGPNGDTGLTGRKIIVDTYGGSCPHGGGAFSGKDPSKVDRSGAYMCRYVAKHIVSAGLADRCTVQISYVIGLEEPTSLYINTHGTEKKDVKLILKKIKEVFNFTPNGIIKTLNLLQPIYLKTASYGHFGRLEFPWEIIDDKIIKFLE